MSSTKSKKRLRNIDVSVHSVVLISNQSLKMKMTTIPVSWKIITH